MLPRFCPSRLLLPLAGALLLGACTPMPAVRPDSRQTVTHFRDQREKVMKSTWVGHPYEDLVQVYGAPRMIMTIPARAWNHSVMVYEGLDTTSDCIDAFTVVNYGKPVVNDYFCR